MKNNKISILLLSVIIIFITTFIYCSKQTEMDKKMVSKAFKATDIISLFSLSADDIKNNTPRFIEEAKNILNAIIAVDDHQRTYANTLRPLDELDAISNLAIAQRVYEALELLSPNEEIRSTAHDAFLQIYEFYVDYVLSNKDLYRALIAYETEGMLSENLSSEQHYFTTKTIDAFKKQGFNLPDEKLARVNAIRKELTSLCADFDRNIAQDRSTITVTREQLEGLDESFINKLKRTENDEYLLGVDYPTYFKVMENCSNATTRKALYNAFNNRAYPANEELLKKIIASRDELGQLLGFKDFAHYDIDEQMASTPERAQSFINDLIKKSQPKVQQEIATLTQSLPSSVTLSENGKIQQWDFLYLENYYKKIHFNIDEEKIAEYFPMQKTIDELLDIYHQFFSIDFQEIPCTGLWHDDIKMIQVTNKTGQLIGTLILDLFPRPYKYSHAAHTTIIPGTITPDGTHIPDVSIVIANFTKPSDSKPSLLKQNEVKTFFHEFGHALHAILGATTLASLSGTHTKTDFVELPSQILEEWLTDKDILKKVSCHYITQQPLPDEIIDTIITSKHLTTGYFVTRQTYLSSIALSYFGSSSSTPDKDPHDIMQQLFTTILPYLEFNPDNHFYTSFGHLTGYGAKYYGYLWSKVFALDIFAEIKKHGLLDPVIGQKYVKEIIGKGGAQDPNELLYNFLGREPSTQAFFDEMGLH